MLNCEVSLLGLGKTNKLLLGTPLWSLHHGQPLTLISRLGPWAGGVQSALQSLDLGWAESWRRRLPTSTWMSRSRRSSSCLGDPMAFDLSIHWPGMALPARSVVSTPRAWKGITIGGPGQSTIARDRQRAFSSRQHATRSSAIAHKRSSPPRTPSSPLVLASCHLDPAHRADHLACLLASSSFVLRTQSLQYGAFRTVYSIQYTCDLVTLRTPCPSIGWAAKHESSLVTRTASAH
jgi:hypothetical protein